MIVFLTVFVIFLIDFIINFSKKNVGEGTRRIS